MQAFSHREVASLAVLRLARFETEPSVVEIDVLPLSCEDFARDAPAGDVGHLDDRLGFDSHPRYQ